MINKVTLLGRLGKVPERVSESLVKFSLATSEKYKDKNGNQKEDVEWHNISVWGKQSDIAERYLDKGSLIYLEGRIKTDSWEKGGEKKYSKDIVATNFKMLDGRKSSGQENDNSGDLPF